ncbi:MAG TPA: sulfate adenylyltransferase [Candidatus Dormibacteraeota bacterium]
MSKGFVVWLTGLSGAGKSTIANRLRDELVAGGHGVEVLDGDEVRTNLSKGLGFSKEDRDTNIRRIGYVAGLLSRHGAAVITAAISPYQEIRDEVRSKTPGFVEVYVRCSLEELVRRDVKGLYQKAIAGEIPNFTGVSDPYEAPVNPEVVVDSESETVEESVAKILAKLATLGYTAGAPRERFGTEADLARADRGPRLDVGPRAEADLYMLGVGALAPLTGFAGRADYDAILAEGRLASSAPFTIPVTLRVDKAPAGDVVALWRDGRPLGLVEVHEVFETRPDEEALAVFGTTDEAHPGVRAMQSEGRLAVAGDVVVFGKPPSDFPAFDLTPREVRAIRDERGWRTMVGFQTRNPVHRAHEYLQKVALEMVDGLLLHPLVGETKADDIPADIRMRCYEALLEGYYPAERTLLATNPAWMRYAGPKEAVFHAIVRRNYGCTHFIVGRDHAGVGNYYDTYAAHRIFDGYRPGELGIELLRFEHTFWCQKCGAMASTRTCPHGADDHLTLSGTKVRELLRSGAELPGEFSRPEVAEVLREAYAEPEAEAAG